MSFANTQLSVYIEMLGRALEDEIKSFTAWIDMSSVVESGCRKERENHWIDGKVTSLSFSHLLYNKLKDMNLVERVCNGTLSDEQGAELDRFTDNLEVANRTEDYLTFTSNKHPDWSRAFVQSGAMTEDEIDYHFKSLDEVLEDPDQWPDKVLVALNASRDQGEVLKGISSGDQEQFSKQARICLLTVLHSDHLTRLVEPYCHIWDRVTRSDAGGNVE